MTSKSRAPYFSFDILAVLDSSLISEVVTVSEYKMEHIRHLTARASQEVRERSSVLIEHTTFYGKSNEKTRFQEIRSEIDNYYLGCKVRL